LARTATMLEGVSLSPPARRRAGSSVEVIHIVGPYEFTTGVEPMKINEFMPVEFMPVEGSRLTHIAE
jgi:hypothetical protein